MMYENKIRFFNWANLILPLLAIPLGVYSPGMILISILFYYFIIVVGVDIGLHRLFCHSSFKTNRFYEYFLTLLTIPATTGSPLVWSAIHRCHHNYSDTDKDPHSPKKYSAIQLLLGLWDAKGLPLKMALPREFDTKFHKFIHKWYFTLILLYCAFLSLFGISAILYFYVIPSALVHIHQSFINIFSHSGPYNSDSKDYSNNIPWVVYIYPVLGYHHVHHLHPKLHRLGPVDLAATLIEKVFSREKL